MTDETTPNVQPQSVIEKAESKWFSENRIKQFALIVAVLGLVFTALGFAFTYIFPAKEVQLEARITYAGTVGDTMSSMGDSRLRIIWKDSDAKSTEINKCSIVSSTLKNTGTKTLIWKDHVLTPVTFSVPKFSQILGVGTPSQRERDRKSDIRYTISEDKRSVTVVSDYLSPDEEVSFAIYHTDSDPTALTFDCRIKDQPKVPYAVVPQNIQSSSALATLRKTMFLQALLLSILGTIVMIVSTLVEAGKKDWVFAFKLSGACAIYQMGLLFPMSWLIGKVSGEYSYAVVATVAYFIAYLVFCMPVFYLIVIVAEHNFKKTLRRYRRRINERFDRRRKPEFVYVKPEPRI